MQNLIRTFLLLFKEEKECRSEVPSVLGPGEVVFTIELDK